MQAQVSQAQSFETKGGDMENNDMGNQVAIVNFEDYAMSSANCVRQVNIIQDVMRSVMRDGEHYGTIPGTAKPSLLKPGAEKLNLVFRLRPEYQILRTDMENGHREYEITCTLYHIPTGLSVGQGVGSGTTMENKYRYRGGEKESTGTPVPKDYWNLNKEGKVSEAQELIGGKGFAPGKIDGIWEICAVGEKQEHDNPADYWNTCLKMAKKRAHVDAILTATAASDIFTQDTEDLAANGVLGANVAVEKGARKSAPPESKKGAVPTENIAMIHVQSVHEKGGEKNGKKYVIYGVVDTAGTVYKTFDEPTAARARQSHDNGVPLKIAYKTNQFGNTLVSANLEIPEDVSHE